MSSRVALFFALALSVVAMIACLSLFSLGCALSAHRALSPHPIEEPPIPVPSSTIILSDHRASYELQETDIEDKLCLEEDPSDGTRLIFRGMYGIKLAYDAGDVPSYDDMTRDAIRGMLARLSPRNPLRDEIIDETNDALGYRSDMEKLRTK